MYTHLEFDHDDEHFDELRDLDYEMDDYSLSNTDYQDLDFDEDAANHPELSLDVPYIPTDEKIVHAMLELAEINATDLLFDLGCGDGRILVTAALEHNTRGVGIDMDPQRINEAIEYAGYTGVEHLVHFFEGDLMDADFSAATVVSLYLLDLVNLALRPRLLDELRPGTRIVSHAFQMGDWKADQQHHSAGINIYKWIVPAKIAGIWEWQTDEGDNYRVALTQKYQTVTGSVWINDQAAVLTQALLCGDLLELQIQHKAAPPARFLMLCQPQQLLVQEGALTSQPATRVTPR